MTGRPVRLKKSTMSKDFFYPTAEQRKEKRSKRDRENRNEMSQVTQEPTASRTRNPSLGHQVNQGSPTPPSPNQSQPAVNRKSMGTQTNPITTKDILNEIYTNPNFPSAYSGDLKRFLMQKESLSRHKKRKRVFQRRKVKVGGPYTAIQADTIFYRDYGRQNDGYKYILEKGC